MSILVPFSAILQYCIFVLHVVMVHTEGILNDVLAMVLEQLIEDGHLQAGTKRLTISSFAKADVLNEMRAFITNLK